MGFGFLSLVDLRNGICTAKGSSSPDDKVLSEELAGHLVGEFAGGLASEPVGKLAITLARLESVFSNKESSIRTPCRTCSSPQSQLAVSSNITSLLIITLALTGIYNL